jgi:hypothetical protein
MRKKDIAAMVEALRERDPGVAATIERGGYQACHRGEKVGYLEGMSDLYTIGVSLGRIVRFAGHQDGVYTVLPHSVVVAELMPPGKKIYGFTHDVTESWVGDVPRPFKSLSAEQTEDILYARFCEAYGIPPMDAETDKLLHVADNKALVAEVNIVGYSDPMYEWFAKAELVPDAEALRLTRRYARHVADWLCLEGGDDLPSGRFFERKFKEYMADAGLEVTAPGNPRLKAVA